MRRRGQIPPFISCADANSLQLRQLWIGCNSEALERERALELAGGCEDVEEAIVPQKPGAVLVGRVLEERRVRALWLLIVVKNQRVTKDTL